MTGHDCTAFYYVTPDGVTHCQQCPNTWQEISPG